MIIGIGTDIVEVARIAKSFEQHGEHFTRHFLLPAEVEYCLSNKNSVPFLAARFAAKEAVAKAFGTGIGAQLGWHDIEVCRNQMGQPFVVLHGKAKELLKMRGGEKVHLSMTHTNEHAAAFAVLEGAGQNP